MHNADSAGFFVQADLDEEQRARQREFQRAQGIGELALEQHQGLELALTYMAKMGIKIQSCQFVAKVMLACNFTYPFVYSLFMIPLPMSAPHHIDPP